LFLVIRREQRRASGRDKKEGGEKTRGLEKGQKTKQSAESVHFNISTRPQPPPPTTAGNTVGWTAPISNNSIMTKS